MIKKPDLAVIDAAIERIRSGEDEYSCIALDVAANLHHDPLRLKDAWIYGEQFRQHVIAKNGGTSPVWFNKKEHGIKPRIKALKAFRKACVEAASQAA